MSIKKTLTTSPAPIESKVEFFKEVEQLKGQHKQHEASVQKNEIKEEQNQKNKRIEDKIKQNELK